MVPIWAGRTDPPSSADHDVTRVADDHTPLQQWDDLRPVDLGEVVALAVRGERIRAVIDLDDREHVLIIHELTAIVATLLRTLHITMRNRIKAPTT